MILYKYKSLQGDGLLHALDMIVNQRIYLSTCDSMNDPDEGAWDTTEYINGLLNAAGRKNYIGLAEKLRGIVDSIRFTSFTKEATKPLLWAHYAGGFSGIAFEYEINEEKYDVRKIDYNGKAEITLEQMQEIINGNISPQDVGILQTKDSCWVYEDEYRLFTKSDTYVENIKPEAIILGVMQSKYDDVFIAISRKYDMEIKYLNKTKGNKYKIECQTH